MFITGKAYTDLIKQQMRPDNEVDIAVAFLGEGADALIKQCKTARVICNLESGATNPAVVQRLQNCPHIEIRTLANLHAKVICTNDILISGSANLSANGLGLEEAEAAYWQEAALSSKDTCQIESARIWFNEHWQQAREIDPQTLERANILWLRRRAARPSLTQGDGGLFKKMCNDWEWLKDRNLYLVISWDCPDEKSEQLFSDWKKTSILPDQTLNFYDWENMPEDAYLVDLYQNESGKLIFTGLYKTLEEFKTEESCIQIVSVKDSYEGLNLVPREQTAFLKLIKKYISYLPDYGDGTCVPVYEALQCMAKYGLLQDVK